MVKAIKSWVEDGDFSHGKHILLMLFAWLVINPTARAQKFSAGVETGLNSSGTPWSERRTTSGGTRITEKEIPLIRPVIGIWSKLKVKKHWFFSLGVQYNHIGVTTTSEATGHDNINNVDFNSSTREEFIFKKISFPLMIGYDLTIKKLPANLFIGYRPLYHTGGSYRYQYNYEDEGGMRNESFTQEVDPFDYGMMEVGAARNQKQFLVGLGAYVNPKFYLSFFCAAYNKITFLEKEQPWQWMPGSTHEYSRWDLVLSLKYALLSPSRER